MKLSSESVMGWIERRVEGGSTAAPQRCSAAAAAARRCRCEGSEALHAHRQQHPSQYAWQHSKVWSRRQAHPAAHAHPVLHGLHRSPAPPAGPELLLLLLVPPLPMVLSQEMQSLAPEWCMVRSQHDERLAIHVFI